MTEINQPGKSSVLLSAGVGLICFLSLLLTSSSIPLVWDEPNAILRAESLERWIVSWVDDTRRIPPWEEASINQSCLYTTHFEGHPAFYGFVIATGHLLSHRVLPDREAYRIGPMILFSLACAAFFYRLRSLFGTPTAGVAVALLLGMPRVFGHAHFASIDGPLTSCWMLTWAAFRPAPCRWRWTLVWGVLLGMTMSCKFTGWFAPWPFAIWALLFRDRKTTVMVLVGCYVAIVVFFNVNPTLWHDPGSGVLRFFTLNLTRAENNLNIPTAFFGSIYDLKHPLPWYNTLAWSFLTVPPGTLILAVVGVVHVIRHSADDRQSLLILMSWGILPVVRALPIAPPHDAERLFLPSFPFLAALAGIGFHSLIQGAQRLNRQRHIYAVWTLAGVSIFTATVELCLYRPHWLSYYTPLIGGVRGAAQLGLEPAYYWDGFDDSIKDWLQSRTSSGDSVYCRISGEYEILHERSGKYHYKLNGTAPDLCSWFVLQNRPGFWTELEHEVFVKCTPVHSKYIWPFDVPIVSIYSREQYLQVQSRLKAGSSR